MARRDIAYTMIKSAVDKGIRDIRENPGRGIRSLVDLGSLFADGRFQKLFFSAAAQELRNDQSIYYRMVERVVCGTRPDHLSVFSMNLGYNSWTLGARTIRRIEDKKGFNIPWCIQLCPEQGVDAGWMPKVIAQGKALGIYTYLFYLEEAFADLGPVCTLAEEEPDCAFILFLHPSRIIADFDRLAALPNAWIFIDMDPANPEAVQAAAARLLEEQCLIGGFIKALNDDEISILSAMEWCHTLGLTFFTFINTKRDPHSLISGEARCVPPLRAQPQYPVFPIDLFTDLAQIDCNISTEACLTVVMGDGTVLTQDPDQSSNAYNITTNSLADIFAKTDRKSVV